MATIYVGGYQDYRDGNPPLPTSPIDEIQFLNSGAVAIFGSHQFGAGNGKVVNNVLITGSTDLDTMIVSMSAPGMFSAEAWTFNNWGSFGGDQVILNGTTGNDTIIGSSQRDVFNGSIGMDMYLGGDGRDRFSFDDVAELVAGESYGGGNDVDTFDLASGAFDLSMINITGIETLEITNGSVTAVGSQFGGSTGFTTVIYDEFGSHGLTVNGAAIDLSGVLFSINWTSSVILNGTSSTTNQLIGSTENDVLTGTSSSADTMTGGGGADTLNGGFGADIFIYNAGSELVTGESINGGGGILTIDTIRLNNSDYDFSVASIAGVERLEFGSGNVAATFLSTQLGGSTVIDTVQGSAGANQLIVNAVAGQGVNLAGVDFIGWTSGVDSIAINGSANRDVLTGSDQNDSINGNSGFDTLAGGAGDDSYTLDSGTSRDVGDGLFLFTYDDVSESSGAGIDTVLVRRVGSGVNGLSNYALTANVENGVIEGTGAFTLTGNALANILGGNSAANTLAGGLGSDALFGGDGADTLRDGGTDAVDNRDFLYGGSGNDTYEVWNTLTSAQDVVYEGAAVSGAEGSSSDIDTVISHGEFFRDFYSVGEVLRMADDASESFATTHLIGGATSNAQIFGTAGSNIISTYGGSKTVDAGAGTDAISFSLYDLSSAFEGVNTLVSRAGTGIDYLYDFQSNVDKVDLRSFNFGISGQQVLAQGVDVFGNDPNSSADDYCYFYLTDAGGVDNYVAFVGLTTAQLHAADFITA